MTATTDNPQPPLVSLALPESRPLNDQELKEVLLALASGINQLGKNVNQLSAEIKQLGIEVKEVKLDLKDWMGWLRLVSGVIIVTVGISFLGIILPLAIALWRQSV
jgi:hypothetical protein